jgi:hypothetical protein
VSQLISQALADKIEARIPSAREFRSRLLAIRATIVSQAGAQFLQQSDNDDRTIPLRGTTTQPDRETLILAPSAQPSSGQAGHNISQGGQNQPQIAARSFAAQSARQPMSTVDEETVPLAGAEDETVRLGNGRPGLRDRNGTTAQTIGATDTRHKQRHRTRAVLIGLVSAAAMAGVAGAGVYAWNQVQAHKAAIEAHERAMEQLEERQRELAEQQQAQRQQELQRQQEALRQRAESQRRAEALLRRQQQAEARRERQLQQPPAEAYGNYPGSANYPPPIAAATPESPLPGALAAGVSAAIGGTLGNAVGGLISGGSGTAPGYYPPAPYPPSYPRHPRQGR